MAPSKIRKAIGAVKDRTSISIAKVGNSHSMSDLEVAVLKATRHDEYPADDRHLTEILCLTSYSRAFISYTVDLISKRLSKTRNSTVALKTLVLAHRLLTDGDPMFQQEMFFATRRGTRLLNMSDFRDKSKSRAWDYSAFVRTYALYLDEQLEYRTQGKKGRRRRRSRSVSTVSSSAGEDATSAPVVEGDEGDHHEVEGGEGGDEDDDENVERSRSSTAGSTAIATPVRGMKTERIFAKTMHLQQLLERFLACKPTGEAKANRIVLVALYPIARESFQLYFELTEIMGVLIDRFMEMDIEDCAKVHEIFARLSKQFEELNLFYNWCKSVGIARSSEYPEVERIPSKKLDLMDEFIHEKAALWRRKSDKSSDHQKLELTYKEEEDRSQEPDAVEEEEKDVDDMNAIKALPPPEGFDIDDANSDHDKNKDRDKVVEDYTNKSTQQEADLLNLGEYALKSEEHGDRLALALFDGEASTTMTTNANNWVAFQTDDQSSDWESSLVQSASHLNKQKLALPGGFDMLLLDGMYKQPPVNTTTTAQTSNGSLSSVALGSAGAPGPMLALPAPPPKPGDGAGGSVAVNGGDPFAASLGVAPPAYVQMSEMEKKQRLLVEEQVLWQQYARDGMKGNFGMPQNNSYGMGGYNRNHH